MTNIVLTEIYVHGIAGETIPAGTEITAGAKVYKPAAPFSTFAHAMIISNETGTLTNSVAVTGNAQFETVQIAVAS